MGSALSPRPKHRAATHTPRARARAPARGTTTPLLPPSPTPRAGERHTHPHRERTNAHTNTHANSPARRHPGCNTPPRVHTGAPVWGWEDTAEARRQRRRRQRRRQRSPHPPPAFPRPPPRALQARMAQAPPGRRRRGVRPAPATARPPTHTRMDAPAHPHPPAHSPAHTTQATPPRGAGWMDTLGVKTRSRPRPEPPGCRQSPTTRQTDPRSPHRLEKTHKPPRRRRGGVLLAGGSKKMGAAPAGTRWRMDLPTRLRRWAPAAPAAPPARPGQSSATRPPPPPQRNVGAPSRFPSHSPSIRKEAGDSGTHTRAQAAPPGRRERGGGAPGGGGGGGVPLSACAWDSRRRRQQPAAGFPPPPRPPTTTRHTNRVGPNGGLASTAASPPPPRPPLHTVQSVATASGGRPPTPPPPTAPSSPNGSVRRGHAPRPTTAADAGRARWARVALPRPPGPCYVERPSQRGRRGGRRYPSDHRRVWAAGCDGSWVVGEVDTRTPPKNAARRSMGPRPPPPTKKQVGPHRGSSHDTTRLPTNSPPPSPTHSAKHPRCPAVPLKDAVVTATRPCKKPDKSPPHRRVAYRLDGDTKKARTPASTNTAPPEEGREKPTRSPAGRGCRRAVLLQRPCSPSRAPPQRHGGAPVLGRCGPRRAWWGGPPDTNHGSRGSPGTPSVQPGFVQARGAGRGWKKYRHAATRQRTSLAAKRQHRGGRQAPFKKNTARPPPGQGSEMKAHQGDHLPLPAARLLPSCQR